MYKVGVVGTEMGCEVLGAGRAKLLMVMKMIHCGHLEKPQPILKDNISVTSHSPQAQKPFCAWGLWILGYH